MLNIFLGRKPLPKYRLVPPAQGELEKIIVKTDVSRKQPEKMLRKVADSCHRQRKSDHTFPARFYAILPSTRPDTSRSLRYRTNFIRTWLDSVHWCPLAPMT
jgi:hypothetical protein